MALSVEQIESEALALPSQARARLARVLLESLDDDSILERAWNETIGNRLDDLRSGRVEGIPAEKVFDEIDAFLR